MTDSPRQNLARLIEERGVEMAALSRLIGRNPAYIHQYLNRGSPKRLGEEERRILARYFGVDESHLGGPAPRSPSEALVSVARRPVRAAAGEGALNNDERADGHFAFDPRWLRRMTGASPDQLSLIQVEGDSMAPTLKAGDDILIDHHDASSRMRDGIYVLRIEDGLVVKRLAIHPFDKRITIQSDNPAYPDWPDRRSEEIDVVGRVLWTGRRLD